MGLACRIRRHGLALYRRYEMNEELSNENLLIGCLWEIRDAINRGLSNDYMLDQIDSACASLSPPVDLNKWDNDYPNDQTEERDK